MKYRDIVGNRKKILSNAIMEHNKNNQQDKISNFASVEIIEEEIINSKLKISYQDKNQGNKIFYYEIEIWDAILNVL